MEIKIVNSPIGNFSSVYGELGLKKLIYIKHNKSKQPADKNLQILINQFFSQHGLQDLPTYELIGTKFQKKVWNYLSKIPRGTTESYSSVARKIGTPGAARAVGTACRLNPIPLFIPCHRVVKSDNSIGEFGLGKDNKRFLLDLERL